MHMFCSPTEPPGDDAPDANNSTIPTEEAALKDSNNDKFDLLTTSSRGEIDAGKVGPCRASHLPLSMHMQCKLDSSLSCCFSVRIGMPSLDQVQDYLSNMGSSSSKKPLSSLQIKTAAATALATAAIKAKLLADQEAREIQRLASTVVELQLKKANIKLRRFQLLEEVCVLGD